MKSTKYINKIRQQLAEHLANPGTEMEKVSMNAAARGVDVSVTAISQFLGDKYPGDNKKVAEKIEGWLKRQAERKLHEPILTETIPTEAVSKIMKVARICHIEGEMGVATGDAGVGKTRGVELYESQNPDVIVVKVIPGYSSKTMMRKLHKAAGYNGQGTIIDMFEDVVERLRNTGRLIIIDEAENLPYKAHELLRRIYDIAGIGILLVGMPELISRLRGSKGEYKQLYSRIAIHAKIPSMEKSPDDVKSLVAAAIPGSNGVWKAFYDITSNGRQLEKLIKRSIQVADRNDSEVTPEIVRNAKQYIII